MTIPIQEEPESTIGRKPPHKGHEPTVQQPARSGAAIRREEADESEAGSEIRDRESGDPPVIQGIE
jgi:hypothetical protein